MALDDREALSNFIDALERAEEAARAMAFTRQQEAWLKVVDVVHAVRQAAVSLALARVH